jgi:hypothetical protein
MSGLAWASSHRHSHDGASPDTLARGCGFHDGYLGNTGARRRWRPGEMVAMILGFVLFWPAGLAILGWKLNWFGAIKEKSAQLFASSGTQQNTGWRALFCNGQDIGSGQDGGYGGNDPQKRDLARDTGNSAFEAHKSLELERLEAEYRQLAAKQHAFEAFLVHLRQAKDQEEFERFLKSRTENQNAPDTPTAGEPSPRR